MKSIPISLKALLLTYLMLPCALWATTHAEIPMPPSLSGQNEQYLQQKKHQEIISNKKDWSRNIEQTLPGLLCDNKHYFVTCFEITQQECVDFTQLLVHACLSNVALALPEQLDKSHGEYWGQMIGKCSYDLYEKFMQAKKRKTPNCQITSSPEEGLPPHPAH